MFLIYIVVLHILSVIGLIVFWDPVFLILSIIGNCFFHLIGAEIFYHRYLSHKSFTCSTFTKYFMTTLSLFSGQGGPLSWSVHHRHHHKYSDTDLDPHTPKDDPIGMWFLPTNRRGNKLDIEISRDLIDQNQQFSMCYRNQAKDFLVLDLYDKHPIYVNILFLQLILHIVLQLVFL